MHYFQLQFCERSWATFVFRSKKKKIFMHSGTHQIILYTHFITRMRGFLFILCVVLTIYCSAADRFQKWQEDDIQQEGLRVACTFTNKRQQALLATGRRWIKNQSSKFRRKIARSCCNKSNDTYNSVSSFSLLFLLFLAGELVHVISTNVTFIPQFIITV